jgi:type IV pilus assembly protein PilN
MAQINLLPWREELRKEQTKQFVTLAALALMLTASLIFLVHINIAGMINHQNNRNNILTTEIKKLDDQLQKIKGLEDTKAKLLSRMEIIQSLQQKRPQIVHLFDELVRTIPEGLHIDEIKQSGNTITISGIAESNGRVSAYMRNIDASEWMTKPKLQVIESTRKDGRGSKFILIAEQSAPKSDDDDKTGGL